MEINFKETTFKNDQVPPAIDEDFLNNLQKMVKTDLTNINNELKNKVDKESGKGLSTNDLTNVLKEKIEKYDEISEKLTEIENKEAKINDIKKLLIEEETINTDRNSLLVENTAEGLNAEITEIKSNRLYQETRIKNNLFNITDKKQFGSNVMVDNEGWITVTCDNSQGTTSNFQNCYTNPSTKLKPNTKYYFVFEIKNISGTGNLHVVHNTADQAISQFQENQSYVFTNLKANTVYKFEKITRENLDDSLISSMCKSVISFTPGQRGSITFRISIYEDEEYSTNFNYEAYGLTPSFDIPSPVEGITGDLTISSYNKNLYNVKDIYNEGSNVIVDEDDWISVSYDNSQGTNIHFENFFTSFNNLIQTNKKYYLVVEVAEANGWGFIDLCSKVNDNDKSQFNKLTAIQINSLHAGDVIIKELNSLDKMKENEKCLRSYFQFDPKNVGSCRIRLSILEKEPDVNTFSYTKHKKDSYLISLKDKVLYGNEDIRDRIIRKDGKWFFEKNYDIATLNGGNNDGVWFQESTGTGFRYYCNNQSRKCMSAKNNIINVFSDKLCGLTALDTWNGKEGISGTSYNTQIRLKDFNENKTLSEFKQFLSEKPINIVYWFITPILEEITDNELIKQLDALLDIKLFNNQTSILLNNDATFTVKTEKDRLTMLNSRIKNLENSLNTTQEVLSDNLEEN